MRLLYPKGLLLGILGIAVSPGQVLGRAVSLGSSNLFICSRGNYLENQTQFKTIMSIVKSIPIFKAIGHKKKHTHLGRHISLLYSYNYLQYARSDWLFSCNDRALLARCPSYIQSAWTGVKKGIRWPVSPECITASRVQLTEVTCVFNSNPLTSFCF